MIVETMKLNTIADAYKWAVEYGIKTDCCKKLAYWIWKNRPYTGCTISEHPLNIILFGDFCQIFNTNV